MHPTEDPNKSQNNGISSNLQVPKVEPPLPKTLKTLDHLPVEILGQIMEYLPQQDLVSCCLVSKSLYWPAVKRLYEKISIIQEYHLDKVADDNAPRQIPNYCTILPLKKRYNILSTVENNKTIADLIKSLSIGEVVGDETFSELSEYLVTILMQINLEFFHCLEGYWVPKKYFETAQRMSVYELHSSRFPQTLVDLKINYHGNYNRNVHFKSLARDMIQEGSHHHLKKVTFETGDFLHDFEQLDQNILRDKGHPFWLDFFKVFFDAGIKLNLTALGLWGEFWDSSDTITTDILRDAIDLSKLDTLGLKYNYYVLADVIYKDDVEILPHQDGKHCFLTEIADSLVSLRRLFIKHASKCSELDMDVLCRVLRENIPNQLAVLWVHFDDQRFSDLEQLRSTILAHQRNLVKLELSHWHFCDEAQSTVGRIPELVSLEREVHKLETDCSTLAPKIDYFDKPRVIVGDEFIDLIRANKQEIKQILNSDSIYTCAKWCLPQLTEYFISGLSIHMKTRTILNNGIMLSLDD
ncbi:hypothetical protein JCM33374_g4630 [Metschnikowia sp. JCM 33374]|nr:hypothetical protein JCM33374_g4630 [Metschnikowia sp. JCM 33374]